MGATREAEARGIVDIDVKILQMSVEGITDITRIERQALPQQTVALARWLLGKVLVRRLRGACLMGRIVETEAYLQHDPACHGFIGPTARNRSLFLERGHAYVYLCYGTSYLLNVSSEGVGVGAGVLLRALQPLVGVERMRRRRGGTEADLTRGPGRLTEALDVDLRHDGLDLFAGGSLWIGTDGTAVKRIGRSVRVGLTKAADERLRFFIPGNRFLSGARALNY
jgi:DNA-3-methyladenine glycosylase